MDIETLKIFLAVVEEGTFLKASKALATTQPNISKHIASLEKECGVKLFLRDKSGARLTEEGKLFLPAARDIVVRAEKILEDLAKTKQKVTKDKLFIGVPDNLDLDRIVPGFFLSLLTEDEGLKLKLVKLPEEEILEKLEGKELDCAFYQSIYSIANEDIVGFAVTRENPVLLYSDQHPVTKKKKYGIDDFKASKFFRCTTGKECHNLYTALPFEPTFIEEVFEESMAMMYIESGEGAGVFVPGLLEQGREGIHYLTLETMDKVGIDLIYGKGNSSPDLEKFSRKLKEYTKKNS